jgi:predicted RNase H-like HicB family nuclease
MFVGITVLSIVKNELLICVWVSYGVVMAKKHDFYVVIERDEDGYFVGEVPQLKGCYSQGETLDALMVNIREVIELCLEDEQVDYLPEFIGVQKVTV